MKYTIVSTNRNGKALYFEQNIYYQLKPKDPITSIIVWRCKYYHDSNFRCKVLIKSDEENVISINSQHEAHPIVTDNQVIMMEAKKQIKTNILSNKGPIKKTFEETINDVIGTNRIPLQQAAEHAPKYKNIQKTLYKIRMRLKLKRTSFQVILHLFRLMAI